MFNLLIESGQAYTQVGMFLGALMCLGLGGLILGNSLYWRVHAVRVSGTIIGVTAENGMYCPVYRYAAPDGQMHEAKSDTSSGGVGGKNTGRVVPLMISAHNPTQARQANSYLLEIIGLLIAAPGIWLGYTALTAYPVTWMTWIMAVAMIVYLAERGHRILIPKGQRLSIEEWKKQHGLGRASAIDLSAVKPIEDIGSAPELQKTQQAQFAQYKKAAPLIGLLVVVLIGFAIYQGLRIAHLEAAGLRAPGVVVRMKEESSSGGHYDYFAVVRYRTDKNASVEFKDDFGSNPPSHRVGDKVTVLYLADNPQDAIIDRGIWWNWAIPAILVLVATFVVGLLIAVRRGGASSAAVVPAEPRSPQDEALASAAPTERAAAPQ
jgi:hypothetical protein